MGDSGPYRGNYWMDSNRTCDSNIRMAQIQQHWAVQL